jgi:CHAD domain-containing protein
LRRLQIKQLMKRLRRFLKTRPAKLRKELVGRQGSAYKHLEQFVVRQEEISKQLALNAQAPPELHKLRLSIKAWRYLLVEFYGLTNLELVRAQQLLGKLNDLHRITGLLSRFDHELVDESLSKLTKQQNNLLDEFEQIRKNLPFGLRPRVLTISSQSKRDLKL